MLVSGRYRVADVLGRGGMAVVYLARTTSSSARWRSRCSQATWPTTRSSETDSSSEGRASRRASPTPTSSRSTTRARTTRQPVHRHGVRGRPLPARRVSTSSERLLARSRRSVGVQVCAGLEHAHATGLVHRDIKPGNSSSTGRQIVKIADFGIARAAETTRLSRWAACSARPRTSPGAGPGRRGDRRRGHLLIRLRPLRVPHRPDALRPDDVAELAGRKTGRSRSAPVRELRPERFRRLEAVVMRSLARNPEYRPPSAAALGQRLAGSASATITRPLPQASGVLASEVRTGRSGAPERRDTRSRASRPPHRDRRRPPPARARGRSSSPSSGLKRQQLHEAEPGPGRSSRPADRATRPTTGRASPTGSGRTRARRPGRELAGRRRRGDLAVVHEDERRRSRSRRRARPEPEGPLEAGRERRRRRGSRTDEVA